jgi:hypothetical protein
MLLAITIVCAFTNLSISMMNKRRTLPVVLPLLDWQEFSSRFNCLVEDEPSILQSIRPYRKFCGGNSTQFFNESKVRAATKHPDFVGISIRSNQVRSFDALPAWSNRLRPVLAALRDVAELVTLPDVDFAMWLHDGASFAAESCVPVLVQEKLLSASGGILTPPRSSSGFTHLVEWGEEANIRIARHARDIPFAEKKNQAFFRGSPTGLPTGIDNWQESLRSKIVRSSLDYPTLLDARFSTCEGIVDQAVCAAMTSAHFVGDKRSHSEQWQYKLIVVPDGNSVPDRLLSFLASNVVVLKSDSPKGEYWYTELQPFRHYIPFKSDGSDIASVIDSALRNTSQLEYIARESTLFVLRRLNPDRVRCYWGLLLREYATMYASS